MQQNDLHDEVGLQMKSLVALILITGFSQYVVADKKSNSDTSAVYSDGWKVFKSNLGWEIQHPDCLKPSPSYSFEFDDDVKKLTTVSFLAGEKDSCKIEDEFSSFTIARDKEEFKEIDSKAFANQIESGTKYRKRVSPGLDLFFNQDLDHKVVFYSATNLGEKRIRVESYIICGKERFIITTGGDMAKTKEIEKNFNAGKRYYSKTTEKMIESFKCKK